MTESIVATISKGPLVIFLLYGFGFWQLSKMTDAQIQTIEKLVKVFSNPFGAVLAVFLFFMMIFITTLYPAGKFTAGFAKELIELQKNHNEQHGEHVQASKKMYHIIQGIDNKCLEMHSKIDKFYGKG